MDIGKKIERGVSVEKEEKGIGEKLKNIEEKIKKAKRKKDEEVDELVKEREDVIKGLKEGYDKSGSHREEYNTLLSKINELSDDDLKKELEKELGEVGEDITEGEKKNEEGEKRYKEIMENQEVYQKVESEALGENKRKSESMEENIFILEINQIKDLLKTEVENDIIPSVKELAEKIVERASEISVAERDFEEKKDKLVTLNNTIDASHSTAAAIYEIIYTGTSGFSSGKARELLERRLNSAGLFNFREKKPFKEILKSKEFADTEEAAKKCTQNRDKYGDLYGESKYIRLLEESEIASISEKFEKVLAKAKEEEQRVREKFPETASKKSFKINPFEEEFFNENSRESNSETKAVIRKVIEIIKEKGMSW